MQIDNTNLNNYNIMRSIHRLVYIFSRFDDVYNINKSHIFKLQL